MSNSVMKDGKESIPLQTAIGRWADRAFKAEAEIDRLRHDIERMQEIDSEHLAEIDKCNAICDGYADENQRFSDEIDRLRAENAELREDISEAINQLADPCDTCDFESREKALEATIDAALAILAKTEEE